MAHDCESSSDRCQLCGRAGAELTRHHLIPRTRHGNKRSRRRFALETMRSRILWLCRPCHKQIHALFTEKELAEQYHSREALLKHEEVQRFVAWIGNKPAGFVPATALRRRRR